MAYQAPATNTAFLFSGNMERQLGTKKYGVYLLYKGDEVVYVGQSKNDIERRVLCHTKDKDFDSFSIVECEKEVLDVVESALIYQHTPKYNKSMPNARHPLFRFVNYVPYWSSTNFNCKLNAVVLDGKMYVDLTSAHDFSKDII